MGNCSLKQFKLRIFIYYYSARQASQYFHCCIHLGVICCGHRPALNGVRAQSSILHFSLCFFCKQSSLPPHPRSLSSSKRAHLQRASYKVGHGMQEINPHVLLAQKVANLCKKTFFPLYEFGISP